MEVRTVFLASSLYFEVFPLPLVEHLRLAATAAADNPFAAEEHPKAMAELLPGVSYPNLLAAVPVVVELIAGLPVVLLDVSYPNLLAVVAEAVVGLPAVLPYVSYPNLRATVPVGVQVVAGLPVVLPDVSYPNLLAAGAIAGFLEKAPSVSRPILLAVASAGVVLSVVGHTGRDSHNFVAERHISGADAEDLRRGIDKAVSPMDFHLPLSVEYHSQ